jgi:large subunit ribosomal protein L15
MELFEIKKIKGNKTKSKRIGRGRGSGKGSHTVGFGTKGQKARSGKGIPVGFEGGQVPLYKKLPKIRGFRRSYSKSAIVVNLSAFNIFDNASEITPQLLFQKRIIRKPGKAGVKILGFGELEKKLVFFGFIFSSAAKKKIEASGSSFKSGV